VKRENMFNKKVLSVVAGLATIASIAISGPAANAANTLTAGGSSFAGGILTACAATFNGGGYSVAYTSSSSGTGRTSFASGAFDFGAADAPYETGAPSDLLYIPLVGGPVAVGYNVPGLNNLNLTPTLLGDIFSGKVNKWNAAAIKSLNPAAKLPNQKIIVVYRNTNSGTTQNFSKFLKQNGASGWDENASFATAGGFTGSSAQGKAASIDVVNYVDSNSYTIGYSDLKDTLAAHLKFAAIKNGHGQFVKPSVATSTKFFLDQAKNVQANGLVNFNYKANVPGAYNLNLVTYGLAHSTTSKKGSGVKMFFGYVLKHCAPSQAPAKGYVPLTRQIKDKAFALVKKIK
jgi:phosphate transport system substrate-binding protein